VADPRRPSVRTEQIEAAREVLGWTHNDDEYDDSLDDTLADIVDAVNKVARDRTATDG